MPSVRCVALLASALVMTSALTLGCNRKVSQPQCDQLIEHFAELVVKEHFPDAGPEVVTAERAREREEAKGDELRNCTSEVQASEHACAMKAQTSEGVIKCLE